VTLFDGIQNIYLDDYNDARRWLYESAEHFEEKGNYGFARILNDLFQLLEEQEKYMPRGEDVEDGD
jgi:hypothetical protein